jgi:ADP-ribosylglycohydrolase
MSAEYPMDEWKYVEDVYAGVLGKVIGVYMGRPFEGWRKERIQETFGSVDRFVHEEVGKPLVVADDDITGTFTFWRVLEDTGLYAETPPCRFGDNWLNYIIPERSILWWGGVGVSTEHTAFRRLQDGLHAPESGSIGTNGRTVAEQIGAQIFIDGFGLVCPGRPETAAELAAMAGSVSHDGEAVNAAKVVAAMEAAAFIEKDMERLLDIGVSVIPAECMVARLHNDVRAWCREDRNWERTFERIDREYGYHHFGGNCHVIPNHAVMVMAWCYAPDDFHRAQEIINTAGWDTDCNAANVGCLMGIKVGLSRIEERYPYRRFFADRLLLPTAEGTYTVSDCLTEARKIAVAGQKIAAAGRAVVLGSGTSPADGAVTDGEVLWHCFGLPGALHGYMAEEYLVETRGTVTVDSVPVAPNSETGTGAGNGEHRLRVCARGLGIRRVARVSTPVWFSKSVPGYHTMTVPRLYSGTTVVARVKCGAIRGETHLRTFLRLAAVPTGLDSSMVYSDPAPLISGESLSIALTVPDTGGIPVADYGFEIGGRRREPPRPDAGLSEGSGAQADLYVLDVRFDTAVSVAVPEKLPRINADQFAPGWLTDVDNDRAVLSNMRDDLQFIGKNDGWGFIAAGTRDWRDYEIEAEIMLHSVAAGGMFVRYQGIRRLLGLALHPGGIRIFRRLYDESCLWERQMTIRFDRLYIVRIRVSGPEAIFFLDGEELCTVSVPELPCGGIGFFAERGNIGFKTLRVESLP